MRIRKTWSVALAALALGGCADQNDDAIDTKSDEIIRATANGGRNEVVMLFSVISTPDGIFNGTCTGSYYAPRVVLTAAHCLQNIISANSLNTRPQLFVYFGDNFAVDRAELTQQGVTFIPPPIGSPSHFAQPDSFTVHPNWDPNLIHPDMGVVFLDRKPPFDPLPFWRNRVAANLQVTISGWGSNSAPTPTTGAGAQVQRTGRTRTLGSPTAADFHPEDPNPGMLDPVVRANTMKMDGRAPNSNGCFGDSGGPFIINQFGQAYSPASAPSPACRARTTACTCGWIRSCRSWTCRTSAAGGHLEEHLPVRDAQPARNADRSLRLHERQRRGAGVHDDGARRVRGLPARPGAARHALRVRQGRARNGGFHDHRGQADGRNDRPRAAAGVGVAPGRRHQVRPSPGEVEVIRHRRAGGRRAARPPASPFSSRRCRSSGRRFRLR